MRNILISILLVVAMAVPAMAAETRVVAGYDGSDTDIAVAGGSGRVVITDLKFDAANATDDITFYVSNGDCTEFSADEAAAQTLLSTVYDSSIATNAIVFLYRADGRYAELKTASAYATTGVLTVGATDYAYKDGDKVCEAEALFTWSSVGTDAITISSDSGIMSAPKGSPIGGIIEAGVMTYMTGAIK